MVAVLALAFQGTRPLWDPDEGRFTSVALEMLATGNVWLPALNDAQVHLTKPPLTYWALAASLHSFGTNTWAARLPNSLALIASAFAVLLLAGRFVPRRPWLGVFVFGTSLLPLLASNVITTDTWLLLFETVAMAAFLRGQREPRWVLVAWLALALGFMTKGPPVFIPLLVLAVWFARRERAAWLFPWQGLALFAVVGLSWFAWLLYRQPELWSYFLGYEFYGRIFTDVHDRHPQWYGAIKVYAPILLLATLPWVARGGWWRILPALPRPSFWRELANRDPDRAFLLLWFLLPLAIFALAQSRLFLYVLPLSVPLALLIARSLDGAFPIALPTRWRVGLALWVLAVFAIKAATTQLTSHKDAQALAEVVRREAPAADRVLFANTPARYGLRFYLGVPVEQVGQPHESAARARGAAERDLCTVIALHPRAAVFTSGTLLGKSAEPHPPPPCSGWRFWSKEPSGGLWFAVRSSS